MTVFFPHPTWAPTWASGKQMVRSITQTPHNRQPSNRYPPNSNLSSCSRFHVRSSTPKTLRASVSPFPPCLCAAGTLTTNHSAATAISSLPETRTANRQPAAIRHSHPRQQSLSASIRIPPTRSNISPVATEPALLSKLLLLTRYEDPKAHYPNSSQPPAIKPLPTKPIPLFSFPCAKLHSRNSPCLRGSLPSVFKRRRHILFHALSPSANIPPHSPSAWLFLLPRVRPVPSTHFGMTLVTL